MRKVGWKRKERSGGYELPLVPFLRRRRAAGRALEFAIFMAVGGLVSLSAVVTKEATRGTLFGLVATDSISVERRAGGEVTEGGRAAAAVAADPLVVDAGLQPAGAIVEDLPEAMTDRWFNGRPVRPVRTMWMTVTGYSPDSRSCGTSADGKTATMHDVWTNAMRLAAADTRLIPFGSMISVPGYDNARIIPVLDRGGKIKGRRIDLLFPTHEAARRWGVRKLPITVWGYADGMGADDYRDVRDSRSR
ncbi:MAG: 3D domain-containing protein [Phycisphaerae bacterium]|nr:3D domain-containing protein [Phycisphaerae bacterium]